MTATRDDTATMVPAGSRQRARTSNQKNSRIGIIVGAGLIAVAIGLGGGYLLFRSSDSSKPQSGNAAAALAAGLQAEVLGDSATATAKFREVVSLDPKNKLAYYNLGLIEQTAKDVTAAESDYRKTLELDPKYAPALYNLGIIRANAGGSVEAIDLYGRATVADPSFARAYLNLGLLLFDTGDKAGSAAALSKAVQLDPTLLARIPDADRPAA